VDLDASANTLTINITPVNDAPVAQDDSALGLEDASSITGQVVASDVDNLASELSYSLVDDVDPSEGELTFNADGSYSFVPAPDFFGEVTFTYQANDGELDSNVATVTITVTPVNDAPELTGAQAAIDDGIEDTAFTVTAAQLLQGFSDVDGDTLSVSSFSVDNATFVENLDGSFTITPNANFADVLTLNYQVVDGNGGSVAASNTVLIQSVNDPAEFDGSFSGSVVEATASDGGVPSVMGMVTFTDVDELNPFFQQVATPQLSAMGYGTFTLSQTGTWVYMLDNDHPDVEALDDDEELMDSFVIRSADGTEQTITITINGATDVVYVSPPVFTGTGDPNDFDSLGNPLGQNLSSSATTGSDTINGGGGDDIIYGGSGGDSLGGGNGGDNLYGGSGNDTISGQNNNDVIVGGYGADILSGAGGADQFVYLSNLDTGDTISDFSQVQGDKIVFQGLGLASGGFLGALTQAGAVGANQFGYMYDAGSNTTTIYVDTDGVIGADLEITLLGNVALTGSDFLFGP
jgi:VCBS repeat-containing protein